MKNEAIGCWADVVRLLRSRPAGTLLKLPRSWLEHPRAHGMQRGFGLPSGQLADYVEHVDGKTRLEVTAYRSHYIAQLQVIDSPSALWRPDAPAMSGVVLGAVLGGTLGRSESALMAGAAVGGVLWSALRR